MTLGNRLPKKSPLLKLVPGQNIIADAEVRVFADLARLYPLPNGYAYRQDVDGSPLVFRLADKATFTFIVEEDLLTFEIPRTDAPGTRTVEVFKRR